MSGHDRRSAQIEGWPRLSDLIRIGKGGLSVARIRPLTKDEVAPQVRTMLEQAEGAFGEPLISTGIQAYCPPILEASRALGAAPARSGTLPPWFGR
jgi:hypothetical protein